VKTLLIVEDELVIRQGVKAIALHAKMEINEIIECKNGQEALDILNNRIIDVMITDIRMPKIDGITLVKKIRNMENKPYIIVISGYDDFSYAVEMLRMGVRDYVLKPIEREKLTGLLMEIDKEISEKRLQACRIKAEKKDLAFEQLKYLFLNEAVDENEISILKKQFQDDFGESRFVVCCINETKGNYPVIDEGYLINSIKGKCIYIMKDKNQNLLHDQMWDKYCMGISSTGSGFDALKRGYSEALTARKAAFAKGRRLYEYEEQAYTAVPILYDETDRIIQMMGNGKFHLIKETVERILDKTRNGILSPDYFEEYMGKLVERLYIDYRKLIKPDDLELCKYLFVYQFQSAGEYCSSFLQWLETFNERLEKEYDESITKQKIKNAIEYIAANYDKDINMAVVSNAVSLNYSVFSVAFKKYTDMNFLQYLKKIRIDKSKKLLENSHLKIAEISTMAGFENEKHFMRTFKLLCGVSPTEYRKNVLIRND